MENEEFRFGPDRVLSVWIIHGGALFFILVFGPTFFSDSNTLNLGHIGLCVGFFTLIFGPHTFLYSNHLRHEKETLVYLGSDQITIVKNNSSKTFKLDDILEVQEYEASKTPWMIIVKWKIISNNDEETISSITFPRTKAWQFFGLKINKKSTYMPTFP